MRARMFTLALGLVFAVAGRAGAQTRDVTYIDAVKTTAAFARGVPLLEVEDYKVHASSWPAPVLQGLLGPTGPDDFVTFAQGGRRNGGRRNGGRRNGGRREDERRKTNGGGRNGGNGTAETERRRRV